MPVGIFTTNSLATDLAAKSFAGAITRISPNGESPLFALTAYMKTETAAQIEHGYFSKTMIFPSVVLGASVADGTVTTLTVTDSSNILAGMVLRVDSTGENMIVNSVVSTTQIVVTRGVGTVAAAAISNSVSLWMVGNAFEQGSQRPAALNIAAVRKTNYTQIFRNSWAITETARATLTIAGDTSLAENKQECMTFHAADIEKALFYGQKFLGTRNGAAFSTMDGLINTVTTDAASNVTTLGGTTNLTQLEAAIDPVFNQRTDTSSDNSRVMFVGGTARRVLNQIGRLNGTVQIVDGQTAFGLQFSSFKLSRGTVQIIEHPLFNAYGASSSWSKMGVVVDLPTFSIAYLGNRKTQHKSFNAGGSDATDYGMDGQGGTLTTECTALFKNVAANAILNNFTAGAAG